MCQVAVFSGVKASGVKGYYKQIQAGIRCNTWGCPECRPRKARLLVDRAQNGNIGNYQSAGFRSRYDCKLLTLTCPGADYRQKTDNPHTVNYTGGNEPDIAYRKMLKDFNKLMTAVRKSRKGDLHYIRVVERHRDGYPHLHVVLVGSAVRPKDILAQIQNLWMGYGQGRVWLTASKRLQSVRHAIFYALKYLSKGVGKYYKTSRPVSASKGALLPMRKKQGNWLYMVVRKSRYVDDEVGYYCQIVQMSAVDLERYAYQNGMLGIRDNWDDLSDFDYEKKKARELKKNLEFLLKWFDTNPIDGHRQLTLF